MRRLLGSFLLVGLLLVSLNAHWASGQETAPGPIALSFRPIDFVVGAPEETRFGKLEWRGGLQISSTDPRFGGFSSLAVSSDGDRLLSTSDQGWWLKLGLKYDAGGKLAGVENGEMAAILDKDGNPYQRKYERDTEAMTPLSDKGIDGPVAVGFESKVRIDRYDIGAEGFAARPQPVDVTIPKMMKNGPGNAQLEAMARFPSGKMADKLVAISEANLDKAGNIRAWLLDKRKSVAFAVERLETFKITDVAVLPNQDLVTVERDFSATERRLRMAIRRFSSSDIAEGKTIKGEILMKAEWPRTSIDNMEALATYRSADGEQRLLVMSDDNYNGFLQRTLLLQFALKD
ncbi:hypothetical protein FHS85_000037 [Rhodoligotrophos appendicifer]|uniref:esterase-like activity of phytase family protein n=1 Tax=Rhodoligotrophos appendicifer TaxID=987056 RepID=UPI001478F2D3|nr:esterase-like activity of phytase family protein [Rhodoligotrophos appendicifer]